MTMPATCVDSLGVCKLALLTEKCELGQVTESDDQIERSLDAVSVEVSVQEIEKSSDALSVEVCEQDSSEGGNQLEDSNDENEKSDPLSVEVCEQNSNEDPMAELDDEIEKSNAVSVDVTEQDSSEGDNQLEESNDEIEKSDPVSAEASEQDLKEGEDQVTESHDEIEKSNAVSVGLSEHDSNIEKPSIEVSEQYSNEAEDQVSELDAVSVEVSVQEIEKSSDALSVEVCEQDSNEDEDPMAELDDEIERSNAVSVDVTEQDSSEGDNQLEESNDEIEKSDPVSVEASEQDLNEGEDQVTELDDEIEKSNAVSVDVIEQDSSKGDNQLEESNDEIEKSYPVSAEASEQDLNEVEDQVTESHDEIEKSNDVSVGVSEHDSKIEKSDVVSVEVSEQYSNEAEDQVSELDAVNGKVNEDPVMRWNKDYPPLPKRSQKVKSSFVAVLSKKEVSNSFGVENVGIESVAEPFNILMKVPKLDDAIIQEQINLAKLQLEEKTRLRDSIQAQIQEKRANSQTHRLYYESAKDDGNKAKKLVKSKLKQLHEESPDDIDSDEQLHLKILKKELQILKESIATAAAAATEAEKKCDAENVKIKQLQVKCRAANDARQAAYAHLQSLKKKLSAKNQHFFQYKDDAAFAYNYARSGNKKALHRVCANQVEKLMELWNTNDEFRQDYVKSNTRSTIQRFGTLDGRSLGPGEKPHVLPSYPHERVGMVDLAPKIPTVKNVTLDGESPKRTKEHENRKMTNKKIALTEAELTKKAVELLRREEAEVKLKEQCRLEELAKAEVAHKKRLRKKEKMKEKKNAAAAETSNDIVDVNSVMETSNDIVDVKSVMVPKTAQKSRPLTKTSPVRQALLLHNWNKKSYWQLMLISLFVSILFCIGSNLSVFNWPVSTWTGDFSFNQ